MEDARAIGQEGEQAVRRTAIGPGPGRLTVDLDAGTVEFGTDTDVRTLLLSDPEAFALVSQAWLRAGWDAKYVYSFTWMGRPVIQLPEDLVRMQEVLYMLQPDVIIETGIAHGGSLIFYACLCKAWGRGRVVGVDIEIRPHNREAIEAHVLSPYITMIEGDSTSPDVVSRVASFVEPGETVLVSLDSKHTRDHVAAELEAYSGLVSVGSYIVAADGIMGDLVGAPRAEPEWAWNNPREAAAEFASRHSDFSLETPIPLFNEGSTSEAVSYWAGGWLRRTR